MRLRYEAYVRPVKFGLVKAELYLNQNRVGTLTLADTEWDAMAADLGMVLDTPNSETAVNYWQSEWTQRDESRSPTLRHAVR